MDALIYLVPAMGLVAAYWLDFRFGELQHWHPLIGFGRYAAFVEAKLNPCHAQTLPGSEQKGFYLGALAWGFVVWIPVVVCAWLLLLLPDYLFVLASVLILYFTLGARSLEQHAMPVYQALVDGELDEARRACAMIVSRDTAEATEAELASACVETVLENANDAVIAPIFWFLCFGPLGALVFRLSNTLDAMWGYRSERFNYFGRVAAKADDALAYLPARLSVLLFSLIQFRAWRVARRDAPKWYSPNAGPVMAAGAGALGIQLGGDARYHSMVKSRPTLGDGPRAEAKDILAAVKLVKAAYLLLIALVCLAALFLSAGHV